MHTLLDLCGSISTSSKTRKRLEYTADIESLTPLIGALRAMHVGKRDETCAREVEQLEFFDRDSLNRR